MLVLSRNDGQQIVIDEDIVVSVSRVAGNRVRIGIDAPKLVRIIRGELELFGDDPRFVPAPDQLEVEHEYHDPVS